MSAPVDQECDTCTEGAGKPNECPNSKRPCGHHCNCSWVHDCCHWCGGELIGDDEWIGVEAEPDVDLTLDVPDREVVPA